MFANFIESKLTNYLSMTIIFNSNKSKGNREKHGIDFHEAQALCTDEDRLEIPAKTLYEPRYLVIEKIKKNKYWSAVITCRGENIRIISVKRSREEEMELYESF